MVDGSDSALDPTEVGAAADAWFRVDDGPPVTVHVGGELDASTSPQLRAHLDAAFERRPDAVVIDLSDLEFIDSVGLSVLVSGHNRGLEDTVAFQIRNLPDGPRRVFEITGLTEVLDLH